MSQRWKNRGAPFTTETGVRVERGDVFEAPAQGRTVRMRRKKLRRVSGNVPVTVAPGEDLDGKKGLYPGVNFGSDRAYEVARDAKPVVTLAELEAAEGSGEDGALLVEDVRRILQARDAEE